MYQLVPGMRVPADLQDGLPTEENAPGAKTFSVTDVLSAILFRISSSLAPSAENTLKAALFMELEAACDAEWRCRNSWFTV